MRERPLPDNAVLADCFLRLHAIETNDEYRVIAQDALRVYAQTYARAGLFAAPFARALRRYLSPARYVNIVGAPEHTAVLREAAHALPDPLLVVRTIEQHDGRAVAYLCRGRCALRRRTAPRNYARRLKRFRLSFRFARTRSRTTRRTDLPRTSKGSGPSSRWADVLARPRT